MTTLTEALKSFSATQKLGDLIYIMNMAKTHDERVLVLRTYLAELNDLHGERGASVLMENVDHMVSRFEMSSDWLVAMDDVVPFYEASEAEKAAGENYDILAGTSIQEAATVMAERATRTGEQTRFSFNGVLLVANPGDTMSSIHAQYSGPMRRERVIAMAERARVERLNAAAPELLEALAWALAELDGRTEYANVNQRALCIEKANRAIAKATTP